MKVAPPESPQHEIFFAPRNPLHPNHLPANPPPRPPGPPPPMPYPETVGQALSPANPSNSHRNRRPNRTCLAGFFGIIHNNSFVFNKTIRKGRTNVSGFWPPPAPKRTHPGTSPATPRSSTSPGPPNP